MGQPGRMLFRQDGKEPRDLSFFFFVANVGRRAIRRRPEHGEHHALALIFPSTMGTKRGAAPHITHHDLQWRRVRRTLCRMPTDRKRVIVVDDHPDTAETLAALLGMQGHEARFTTDPREALPMAKQFRPDVGLLDINMPHIDGCDLARMFRLDADLRDLWLIAVTAYEDALGRAKTRDAGFDGHILKPATVDAIEAHLKRCNRTRPAPAR